MNPQSTIHKTKSLTADGVTDEIVEKMWELVYSDVGRNKTIQTAKKLKKSSDLETIKAVYQFVIDLMPYKDDPPDREQITAPSHFLTGARKGGDCDDMTIMLCGLLTALKIPCRIVTIAWRKEQFTHVIAEAKANGKWIILDATRENDGFNKTVPEHLIKRKKIYENPMEVEMLNDKYSDYNDPYLRLADCGCMKTALSDCKCGGKCGKKCGGKCGKSAGNINNNSNPINILIGNDTNINKLNKLNEIAKQQKLRKEQGLPYQEVIYQPKEEYLERVLVKETAPKPKRKIDLFATKDSVFV